MMYRVFEEQDEGKIVLPAFLGFTEDMVVSLHVGGRECKGKVSISRGNKKDIYISGDLIDRLKLPTQADYQVICNDESIRFGPVIGLLVGTMKSSKLSYYTLAYGRIGGIVEAFDIDNINFEYNVVYGKYYNPDNGRWVEGELPFPDSIFLRTKIPDPLESKLQYETGNRLFNSRFFDKWDFYKLTQDSGIAGKCIPDTRRLSSFKDIEIMVNKHRIAYLKPAASTLARGIIKITKNGDEYLFQDKNRIERFTSDRDASLWAREITRGHRYLVQQGLNPIRIDGRHMDFRVIMQKDHTKEWNCTGIVACIGLEGSMCSNWGYELSFEDALIKALNYSQNDIFKMKNEVISKCKMVCSMLDGTGENYGDLGFDVLIDESFKVWVLEANKRHYHTVPLWINDVQTFYDVKTNPIKYAAALGGFEVL